MAAEKRRQREESGNARVELAALFCHSLVNSAGLLAPRIRSFHTLGNEDHVKHYLQAENAWPGLDRRRDRTTLPLIFQLPDCGTPVTATNLPLAPYGCLCTCVIGKHALQPTVLLDVIEQKLPTKNNAWAKVACSLSGVFNASSAIRELGRGRTGDSVKRKFLSIKNSKNGAGKSVVSADVERAKSIYEKILEKSKMSEGHDMEMDMEDDSKNDEDADYGSDGSGQGRKRSTSPGGIARPGEGSNFTTGTIGRRPTVVSRPFSSAFGVSGTDPPSLQTPLASTSPYRTEPQIRRAHENAATTSPNPP
ncbi:hypothetical protein BDK51DRAFT_51200 [Blyttiomyces helicus]|uniref:Uncharacterized protein n=1 Tax=Blyttiomyces helicus TaxID=388810 RepID=A0A4P9WDK7_9FUNG|nr:hypothetical protein BDK51DRAFT_51200 [Blyttiomyces helicus]|eukprot:RKO88436.1 hypothetical protein BDK51DRAFT_51200 [Blyttiomyces helicus]